MALKTEDALRLARGLSSWMIPPASSWRRKSNGAFSSAGLLWPISILILSLFFLLVSVFFAHFVPDKLLLLNITQGGLILGALASVTWVIARIQKNLMEPLTHLRYWAMRMRGGNLAARIPEPHEGEFAELARDINSLGDSLHALTRDMKEQVRLQTERTAQKSHSLKILYDIATTINNYSNLDDLLTHFLHTLKDLMHAKAASVRLLSDDNNLRLVAQTGLDDEVLAKERIIPIGHCECGHAARDGKMKCQDVHQCQDIIEYPLFSDTKMKVIAVPLKHRGNVLGIYNLFIEKSELIEREEFTSLLTSIGQHLGVAIVKSRLEKDARRLALMEERTLLSHELHDSLAQTLASLRFQVRMLNDTLKETDNTQAMNELNRLSAGLEKANVDLRQLLGHFRTPMDERGLIPAILDTCRKLENETGISVFFQDETLHHSLSPSHEVQVLHIVQEALSNVRKHSGAKNVRVMLRADANGVWHILVEDDGTGIPESRRSSRPGENIGLSIMRERTRHLSGELTIESEADEGTRIELIFEPQPEQTSLNLEFSPLDDKSIRKVS